MKKIFFALFFFAAQVAFSQVTTQDLLSGKALIQTRVKQGTASMIKIDTFFKAINSLNTSVVQTTTGQNWSTSNVVEKINSFVVKKRNGDYQKKIVGIGSSVFWGYGANNVSGVQNGWFNQISNQLVSNGFIVKNHGISGNNTTDVYNRFFTDVLPENPDIVVFGLGLWNEGMQQTIGTESASFESFKVGIYRLINLCRQYEIIPVIALAYGNNTWTPQQYKYVKNINRQLENDGILLIDVNSIVFKEDTGNMQTGLHNDILHPNQAGHDAIAKGVNPNVFSSLMKENELRTNYENCAFFPRDTTDGQYPLVYIPKQQMYSFSISYWVKLNYGQSTNFGKAFLGIGVGLNNRIRVQVGGNFEYVSNGGVSVMSTVNPRDYKWHHIVVTYNHVTQKISFFVDNTLYGQVTENTTPSAIYFLSKSDGMFPAPMGVFVKDIAIYRVPLYVEDITQLFYGNIKKAGCDVFSPLFDYDFYTGYRPINLVSNNESLVVGNIVNMGVTKRKPLQDEIPKITTAERDLIISKFDGYKIYNITTHVEEHWNGTTWKVMTN